MIRPTFFALTGDAGRILHLAPGVLSDALKIHRRDRLGGVVREYLLAA